MRPLKTLRKPDGVTGFLSPKAESTFFLNLAIFCSVALLIGTDRDGNCGCDRRIGCTSNFTISPRSNGSAIRQCRRFLSPIQRSAGTRTPLQACRKEPPTTHSSGAKPRPSHPQSSRSLWTDRQHCSTNRSACITPSIARPSTHCRSGWHERHLDARPRHGGA
jgi:hypothetical protein